MRDLHLFRPMLAIELAARPGRPEKMNVPLRPLFLGGNRSVRAFSGAQLIVVPAVYASIFLRVTQQTAKSKEGSDQSKDSDDGKDHVKHSDRKRQGPRIAHRPAVYPETWSDGDQSCFGTRFHS